jgi:hypothetical protein
MSKAATSIRVFSIYLFVIGAIFIVAPNVLLPLVGFPRTDEVWVRVVGLLAGILGLYYATAARCELTPMIRATVYGRTAVCVFFVAFVVLGFAPPILILFGVIDLVAAVWTWSALRADAP